MESRKIQCKGYMKVLLMTSRKQWVVVAECNDEDDQPTCWATHIDHEVYGEFVWINKYNDNLFKVEIDSKGTDDFETIAECNSLKNAKRWVATNIK